MEQRQGRYSIIVLLLLVTLVVGFSTYTVYRRAGGSVNSNPFLKPSGSPSVLGEQTTLNEPTLEQTPVIPSVYDISEEPAQLENEDSKSDTDNNISDLSDFSKDKDYTPTDKALSELEKKAQLIVSQVENGTVKPEELFSPVLVDFFGTEDLQKVFRGVKGVSFSNFKLNTQTEATADCVLNEETVFVNYTCYFNLFENTWYLYKTTLR